MHHLLRSRTGAASVVSADVGRLSECRVSFQRLARVLICGATLEQHKDGAELVSATEATT